MARLNPLFVTSPMPEAYRLGNARDYTPTPAQPGEEITLTVSAMYRCKAIELRSSPEVASSFTVLVFNIGQSSVLSYEEAQSGIRLVDFLPVAFKRDGDPTVIEPWQVVTVKIRNDGDRPMVFVAAIMCDVKAFQKPA